MTKFVLRIYSLHWRTITEINEEIKLLNELHRNGIQVSFPIADNLNNYIHIFDAPEGERMAVLFSYAEGEKIHSFPSAVHFTIGTMMGRFHQLTQNKNLKRITYTPKVLLQDSIALISMFLSTATEEMNYMMLLQQKILSELEKTNNDTLRAGIVHLDIWFDNLNVTTDGKVTLFDFDFCGNGWQSLDVAYYLMQLANTEKYIDAAYLPKTEQFLAGYQSVTSLSAEEKRLLPFLSISLYFFYLGVQCQRYDNWSNAFLSADYLKRFINGLIKRYAELNGITV